MQFKAELMQSGKTATGIQVPEETLEALGAGRRPAVTATVNGYSYRTTIGYMDGNPMLSFSAEHRDASGIQAGDAVEVEIALDTAPRTVGVPEDLAAALKAAGATAAYEASAPSMKKEYVRQVESAKAQETRERRIQKIVNTLAAK